MSADASKPRLSSTGSPDQYQPTYYHTDKPEVTTSNDEAFKTGERREDVNSGAKEPEKVGRVGANQYPGRPTPKPESVVTAKDKPGTAKRCSERQLQEQRQDLK